MKLYLSLLVFVFCTVGRAQDININKGDFEFNVASTINTGEISADVGLGGFVSDYVLLRLDLGYSDTKNLDQSSYGASLLRFFESRTYAIPYVGLGLGYVSLADAVEEDSSGVEFALLLGLRYYLAENVAINFEFKTAAATEDVFIDGDEPADADYSLGIGLSYLW
jgi:opacity protein-like surface antigen